MGEVSTEQAVEVFQCFFNRLRVTENGYRLFAVFHDFNVQFRKVCRWGFLFRFGLLPCGRRFELDIFLFPCDVGIVVYKLLTGVDGVFLYLPTAAPVCS